MTKKSDSKETTPLFQFKIVGEEGGCRIEGETLSLDDIAEEKVFSYRSTWVDRHYLMPDLPFVENDHKSKFERATIRDIEDIVLELDRRISDGDAWLVQVFLQRNRLNFSTEAIVYES